MKSAIYQIGQRIDVHQRYINKKAVLSQGIRAMPL